MCPVDSEACSFFWFFCIYEWGLAVYSSANVSWLTVVLFGALFVHSLFMHYLFFLLLILFSKHSPHSPGTSRNGRPAPGACSRWCAFSEMPQNWVKISMIVLLVPSCQRKSNNKNNLIMMTKAFVRGSPCDFAAGAFNAHKGLRLSF